MNPVSVTAFSAALFSAGLALTVALVSRRRSIATWCLVSGMLLLGIESALAGWNVLDSEPNSIARRQILLLMVRAFVPAIWLAFSLTYSRGIPRSHLWRWRYLLIAAVLLPVALTVGFRSNLILEVVSPRGVYGGWWIRYGPMAKALNIIGIAIGVCILANIERTFRAAVGTMQWRIKFAVLGIGVICGARIYSRSQELLFSGSDLNRCVIDAVALIIGCLMMTVSHVRRGFAEVEIYPSRAVLQNSVTVLLAGGYLFVVGVLAQLVASFGPVGNFQMDSLIVLAGAAILAVLLLSERLRLKIRLFVSRHFRRPQHDTRVIWTRFTQGLSNVLDPEGYGAQTVKLLAETFNVLSVTLLVFDPLKGRLALGASTLLGKELEGEIWRQAASGSLLAGLRRMSGPFDAGKITEPWITPLRHESLSQFYAGGTRICLPLMAGERGLGVLILADRVNAIPYSLEEMDILKCIGDQVAAGLLQLRLTEELMQNRELGAFQSMSTFFVHDLKNAASSLSLLFENLKEHFDDPDFREDALRAISSAVGRINQIIGRLGSLRQKLELKPVSVDLNKLVAETIEGLGAADQIEFSKNLESLPPIKGDRGQLESLLTNLLVNAREALGPGGKITVETARRENGVLLSVADDGCGMTPAFMKESLFRPFHTTKKKGLGIGMFQSRLIVEAHRGSMQVDSELGRGTTFRITLPLTLEGS